MKFFYYLMMQKLRLADKSISIPFAELATGLLLRQIRKYENAVANFRYDILKKETTLYLNEVQR